MKNILLLILLFITSNINAQPQINQPTSYNLCDINSDGYEMFDLNAKNNEIVIDNINLSVSYHLTNLDAINGTNALNSTSYFNITNPQILYIRVIDTSESNNPSFTTLNLIVNPLPMANQPPNMFSNNQSPFNFYQQTQIIIGGQTDVYVYYYTSEYDANNQINNIISNCNGNTNYYSLANNETIWARIQNVFTSCYSITNFTIQTNYIPDTMNTINFTNNELKNRLLQSNETNFIALDLCDNPIRIDNNNDGEIQTYETDRVITLFGGSISNFEGLQNFNNLESLWCDSSTSNLIDIPNSSKIKWFYCQNCNNLSNIQIDGLSYLQYITITYSLLTTIDLTGTNGIRGLSISNSNLTSIDLSGLNNLIGFGCENNNITSLDFSNNPLLNGVYCSNNNLIQLDFSNNPYMTSLYCENNPSLVSINLKNGNIQDSPNQNFSTPSNIFANNPNLQFICCDEDEIISIQNLANLSGNVNNVFNSYCTFEPGGNYNTITGKVILDLNNNGCDNNDINPNNLKININDGTNLGASFSNDIGNYKFYTQTGSFDISPNVENPLIFTFSPLNTTIPFTNNNNNIITQDFCLTANGIHNDLEIVLMPLGPARPGFDADYKIVYKNKGNQTLSGDLNLTFDDAVLDFISSSIAPNSQVLNNLTWNYSTLLPFETRTILVTFNVNSPLETPAVNLGDVLNFVTTINPVSEDDLPLDNTFTYNQTVVGSFDPNDITCLEGENVSPSEIGKYLHYALQFENTGTYQAENVVVKVVIDTNKYDLNSIQLLNTSNPAYTRITGNVIEFIFETINLSAAIGNPPVGGHGDILFKIKSKNDLVNGDFVSKKANIYFDYNAPIETIPFQTTFQALRNNIIIEDATINIHPNPTNSIINVNSKNTITSLELYDVQGRLLETSLENKSSTTIDISSKQNGIYFLKITSEKGSSVEKIIKE